MRGKRRKQRKKIGVTLLVSGIALLVLLFVFNDLHTSDADTCRIGILMSGNSRQEKLNGLKAGLRDLGYASDSCEFLTYDARDDVTLLEQKAEQLVQQEVDVIVSLGAVETLEVKRQLARADRSVPVVFAGIAAPKELGLISDYKHPGDMFTGVDNYHKDLSAKRLEMFVQLLPDMERVIILYNGGVTASRISLETTRQAAKTLSVPIVTYDLDEEGALKRLEGKLKKNDGILVLPSYHIEARTDALAALSLKHGVPLMGIFDQEVARGFLFGYGASYYSLGYQAARHVSAIAKGSSPNDVPVELPDTITFSVNDEVSKRLDVRINGELIRMANIVPHIATDD